MLKCTDQKLDTIGRIDELSNIGLVLSSLMTQDERDSFHWNVPSTNPSIPMLILNCSNRDESRTIMFEHILKKYQVEIFDTLIKTREYNVTSDSIFGLVAIDFDETTLEDVEVRKIFQENGTVNTYFSQSKYLFGGIKKLIRRCQLDSSFNNKFEFHFQLPKGKYQFTIDEAIAKKIGVPLYLKEKFNLDVSVKEIYSCLLYTSPSPRDKRQSRMPSSA